ncbi:MAG: OB-fold nucleic acid binding domain-containing protein [Candidatus Hermodarchaeota archaeon]
MPLKLAEIVDLIVDKSGKSKDEILQMIEEKKKELDGYVTDEGAASLVARELDLDLFERQPTPELKLSIRDLVAGMTGVSLNLKVIRIFPVRTFQRKQGGEGKVASIMGSDSTGSIRVTFWNDHTKPIEDQEFDEGDILRLINGRVRTGLRDQLEIHLGSGSRIMVNPPDVDTKDFPEVAVTLTPLKALEAGMSDVHVEGVIITKYRVSTFSRGDSEGSVASLVIRDETGRTRLVLWDEQSEWFRKLSVNDKIRIESGYVRMDRNNEPELHLGRRGQIRQLSATDQPPEDRPSEPQALKNLTAGDFPSAVGVVVIENQGVRTFTRRDGQEGKRLVFILADETAKVRAVAWGQAAENLADVEVGTKLLLEGVNCRAGLRQELEIHINESSQVTRNPPNLEIKSPSNDFISSGKPEVPDQILANVTEGNFVTVRGTVVQVIHQKSVYDSCPKCFKKVTISNSTITCPKCGKIQKSEPRLIAKLVIDDGTENIRASLIGNSAEKLFGMSGEDAKSIIEESGNEDEPVRRVEDTLLGKELNLSGRINLNNFSNQLELSVNDVSDADPIETANQLLGDLKRKAQR